ncbi:MAG: hypothetical protein QXO03_04750 [Thermoplasmatales archaeon]
MNRFVYLFSFLSLVFFDLLIFVGLTSGEIIYSSDSFLFVVLSIVFVNITIAIPLLIKKELFLFYGLSYLAVYEFALLVIVGSLLLSFFLIPSILAVSLAFYKINLNRKFTRGISFVLVLLFMFFIGKTILVLVQPTPAPLTIELLADRMMAIGQPTPVTEYAGLFLVTKYADIIISPFQFFIYLVISGLLVENYHLIIPLLTRSGKKGGIISAGYGALSVLGCQCESAIGVFPAASLLVFNSLLLPFFGLSLALLGMTYFLVSKFYVYKKVPMVRIGRRFGRLFVLLVFLLIGSQLIEVVGVLFGLEVMPIFLFGMMMLMILDGFILYYLMQKLIKKVRIPALVSPVLFSISLLIVVVWFFPSFTSAAMSNPLVFSLMSYLSLFSGFIVSMETYAQRSISGITFLEGYAVALGVIPIALFYITFYLQKNIWSFWTFSEQMNLSLILWIVMIPFMWLATQSSLINAAIPIRPGLSEK